MKFTIGLLIRFDSVRIELVNTLIEGETLVSSDDNVASNVNDLAPGNGRIVLFAVSTSLVAIILVDPRLVLPNREISWNPLSK